MRDSSKTFHWLVSILKKHDVPFVVTGGLAAKAYGSPRDLNDIDIDIHSHDFEKIIEAVTPYITFGPARAIDEKWDLPILILNHEGQDIDISGGDDIKIYDDGKKEWMPFVTDFSAIERREIFGLCVPVIAPEQLADYKALLNGNHQRIDIEAAKAFITARDQQK